MGRYKGTRQCHLFEHSKCDGQDSEGVKCECHCHAPLYVPPPDEELIENEEVIAATSGGSFLKDAVMDLLNNSDRPVDNTATMGEYMALKRARLQKGY